MEDYVERVPDDTVVVGLIKGRHDMPVSRYIIEHEIKNVFDFSSFNKDILNFLINEVGLENVDDVALNETEPTLVNCIKGSKKLIVYVTGLTPVVAELIKLCAINGVSLTLKHFNLALGDYKTQRIF